MLPPSLGAEEPAYAPDLSVTLTVIIAVVPMAQMLTNARKRDR